MTPEEEFAALQAKREELSEELDQTKAKLAEAKREAEDLAYRFQTGEEAILDQLEAAEARRRQLSAQSWRLDSALKGLKKRLEAAQTRLEEEQREQARKDLKKAMSEVSKICATIPGLVDQLATAVISATEGQDRAVELGKVSGDWVKPRGIALETFKILRNRLGSPRYFGSFGVPFAPERLALEAENLLKTPWKPTIPKTKPAPEGTEDEQSQ